MPMCFGYIFFQLYEVNSLWQRKSDCLCVMPCSKSSYIEFGRESVSLLKLSTTVELRTRWQLVGVGISPKGKISSVTLQLALTIHNSASTVHKRDCVVLQEIFTGKKKSACKWICAVHTVLFKGQLYSILLRLVGKNVLFHFQFHLDN